MKHNVIGDRKFKNIVDGHCSGLGILLIDKIISLYRFSSERYSCTFDDIRVYAYVCLPKSLILDLSNQMWRTHFKMLKSLSCAIYSFSQAISIASLQVHYYSEALPTQHGYCVGVSRRSATSNCE